MIQYDITSHLQPLTYSVVDGVTRTPKMVMPTYILELKVLDTFPWQPC